MTERPEFAAVVPAAGYSRRMGAFKPILPFGSATVIEQVIATIRAAGVFTIRVVVGWQSDRVIPLLERASTGWILNARFAEGMYTSIQAGVQCLPPDIAAFFLLPGDMPLVRSTTLIRLAAEWDARREGIFHPCHQGRRGHPPLIARSFIPEILAETPADGLRTILTRHTDCVHDVEVEDPGVLMDLDTPEDYRHAGG